MDFIDLKTQYRRIEEQVQQRMRAVFEHGQYILGPEVSELEERLASYVGVRYCIGVASGTDALLIALMALDVKPGDEVITSPFTFIATGEMIALIGAKPVFVDIDPRTYNLDAARLEVAISDRTRAIMPVSLYGQCADMDTINAIAARHDLPVIEDAAQSFGASYKGGMSCSLSEIGCTSFFPAKPLGAYGEGGACFTDDEGLAQLMREIRVHGQDKRYHHARLGINGRLDSLQAAALLAKMDIFPDEVEARGRIGARYSELIEAANRPIVTPWLAPDCTSVYAQYTVQVDDRDAVQAKMQEAGVPTAVHYPIPLNDQPAMGQADLDLPETRKIAGRVMSLPMHPYLGDEDQGRVVEALTNATGV